MPAVASIVVVTHRGVGELVRSCLTSIAESATASTEWSTIVIDNSDGPVARPEAYGPGVDHVVRVDNHGFGAAANAGIRVALREPGGPVAVLNDDIVVGDRWLDPLVAALDDDAGLGAVQPALVLRGSACINSLGVDLDRYGAGSDRGLGGSIDDLGPASSIEVFTGGAVLFRRDFLADTGGFDERYFLYYEDVDLALRGAEFGWRYRCETASVVEHVGGATTGDLGDDVIRLQERNRIWIAARFLPPSTVGRAVWLSIRRVRRAPYAAHARALVAGLAGMPSSLVRRVTARHRNRGAIVSANGR